MPKMMQDLIEQYVEEMWPVDSFIFFTVTRLIEQTGIFNLLRKPAANLLHIFENIKIQQYQTPAERVIQSEDASCPKSKKRWIRKRYQFLQGVIFDWNRIDDDSYLKRYSLF